MSTDKQQVLRNIFGKQLNFVRHNDLETQV